MATNYDDKLSGIIAEALHSRGLRGVIHMEPVPLGETSLVVGWADKTIEGGSLGRGIRMKEMFPPQKNIWESRSPRVVVADLDILGVKMASTLLERLALTPEPVVLFCKWMDDQAAAEVVYNLGRKTVNVAVVTMVGNEEYTSELLADLSAIFGAKLFTPFNQGEFLSLGPGDMGMASRIDITELETFFVGREHKGEEMARELAERVRTIEYQYRVATGNKKQLLEDRLTRLSGKMGLIKIGGESEVEKQETKDKLTDGLNAVRNVKEYGGVPGGGAALVHASKVLSILPSSGDQDVDWGVQLLGEVVREPMRLILANAGLGGGSQIHKLLEEADPWVGYDLNKQTFGDMLSLGVVDSFHNLRNILLDATSVGGMLLTTECVVYRPERYTPTPLRKYSPRGL